MGQSSSREEEISPELRQLQSLVASTGALPSLEKAFSALADPQTKSIPIQSLQKCFDLNFENMKSEQDVKFEEFPVLFRHLGPAIVDLFFLVDKDGVNWIEFLRGYTKCCTRTVSSALFNNLLRVFSSTCSKVGVPTGLKIEEYDDDCKISGTLSTHDVLMLLWVSWIFSWDSRTLKLNMPKTRRECCVPDVSHLILSAIESCAEDCHEIDFWNAGIPNLDIQLNASKFHSWVLQTVPTLADCMQEFVHARLCYYSTREDNSEPSSSSQERPISAEETLLTRGMAWAISLTVRGHVHEEISKACFPSDDDNIIDNVLYRSSVHGKGINRFWSNVGGYNGALLVLISACEEKSTAKRWVIGALTHQGFENKESFYGTSGNLYALTPVFHALLSSGREKNYVYSHLHPTGRLYDAHPKPVGIGFGGSTGNERIFIDEDFGRVTLRHHAVDKTYQHGPLFPNQGFLPTEALVLEVEVWGLGGSAARKIQNDYKKREELFNEQRRKVDLKTFANWEDSPEKMMMDLMSNPNSANRREER